MINILRKKKDLVLLGLVVLISFLVFSKTLSFEFINWDDDINVYKNEVFNQPRSLLNIWFSFRLPSYLPLAYSLFYLQWKLWGREPLMFHFLSLVLHALNIILIFYFLKRVGMGSLAAFFILLIYSIHPARVESVAWITEQKSLLSGVFMWLSFLAFLNYNRKKSTIALLGVGIFYLLALLSKPLVFPLFFIFFLYNFLLLKEKPTKEWFKIGGFLAVIGLGVIAINWLRESKNFIGTFASLLSVRERILICIRSLSYYILRVIFPFDLLPIYPRWKLYSDLGTNLLSILFILTLLGASWAFYRRGGRWREWVVFSLFSYFLTILPVAGLVTIPYMNTSFIADRYSYIPSIFIIMGLVILVKRFVRRPYIVLSIFSLICIFSTFRYLDAWKNPVVFWNYVIEHNPECKSGYLNLGYFMMNREGASIDEIKKAMQLHKKAISLAPTDPLGFYNYGVCLMKLGRFKEAEDYYRKALSIRPEYSDVWNDLGWILEVQGKISEAIQCYKKALEYEPTHKVAQRNLKRILNNKR